jgi:CheY-like chemotaxis protein
MASVLLVEPADDGREMYVEFLRRARLDSICVDNAADALEQAPRADVVVTGIRLRGNVDGVQLVEQLRLDARTKHIPIAVVTACAWRAERDRAMRAGCDAFLAKPCLPSDLLAEIRRLLSKPQAARARGRMPMAKAKLPHAKVLAPEKKQARRPKPSQ